ncbi:MAG: hypothetical protein J4G04_03360 [Nitrosopumilaceae archaeon]|nr:hypothetical protein [Nitrosopumilaceae archaeon]
MRIFKIMSKNPRAFRMTAGASLSQSDFLMRDIEKVYPEIERARLDRPGRKRKVGAGCPFSLYLWYRVLMVLMYCRTYLTQDGMTHLCGFGQGSISCNIALLVPRDVSNRSYWELCIDPILNEKRVNSTGILLRCGSLCIFSHV